jgi:uncharacterized protein (TIGR04255 family)
MVDRDVFPNAPLRLVSLELRYPVTSRVSTRKVWDAFEQALSRELPKVDVLVSDAATYVPAGMYDRVLRRSTEDRKRIVTLHAGAVTVELADYQRYADLIRLAQPTFDAMETLSDDLKCTHMGLRYINEIPASSVDGDGDGDGDLKWSDPSFWEPFVNDELLRSTTTVPDGLCAFGYRAMLLMHSVAPDDDSHVALDYGPHPHGLRDPAGALALGEDSGPCFMVDIDAYAPGTTEDPVASDRKQALEVLSRLHDAAEATFQWSVTERLKEEVFRAPAEGDEGRVRHAANA